ncbi:MAG: hypothetical protein K1X64_09395 [Myxococcaceae bacterium]|nr:hypothetical protein [Myxococcaceae bacterium]
MSTAGIPSIRFRRTENREIEVSAEDLRHSGVSELERLAEADQAQSTTLSPQGNADGWLSTREVEKAGGLHFQLVRGYVNLVTEATRHDATEVAVPKAVKWLSEGFNKPIIKQPVATQRRQVDIVERVQV